MHDLAWVNDPTRSLGDLRAEAAARGLPTEGNRNLLRTRIRTDIAALTAATPTPVAPVTPPVPNPPRMGSMRTAGLLTLAAIAALVIYFAWVAPNQEWWPNEDDDGVSIPTGNGENNNDTLRKELIEEIDSRLAAAQGQFRKDLASLKTEIQGVNAGQLAALSRKFDQLIASNVQPGTSAQTASKSGGVNGSSEGAHFARLTILDDVFRSQGLESWLKAAGLTWDGNIVEARQIEEEVSPASKIVAAGVQVNVKNLRVQWPNIVTTDVKSRITTTADTVQYTPDARNGSTLYTNVVANGPVTIWIDAQNWGQFTSRLGFVDSPSSSTATTNGCFSLLELDTKYGIDRGAQGTSNGILIDAGVNAGAVLRLTADQITDLKKLGWTIQGTNPNVKSAWSPTKCRPLKQ